MTHGTLRSAGEEAARIRQEIAEHLEEGLSERRVRSAPRAETLACEDDNERTLTLGGAAKEFVANTDRDDSSWLALGEVVNDRYSVQRVLGLGGMGLVVEALDVQTQRVVALKFLRPSLCLSGDIQKRFLREMRTLSKLASEHTLQVIETGRYRELPFIVTEFLSGETVADRLDRQGPLAVEQAVDWVLQACEGLSEAHRLGIVHRDLKPENLFLQRLADGSELVKVLDFGISRTPRDRNGAQELETQTHVVLGSPYYMSPEQLSSSKNADARSDVWSLGVTLFQLLTDALPFPGMTFDEIATSIVNGHRPRVRELRDELPEVLEAVIDRCLQRDRLNRPQSLAELCRELVWFAPPGGVERVRRICAALGVDPAKEPPPTSSGKGLPPDILPRNDRYKPLVQLGEGGSARVTLAVTQGRFNKVVVLKSLLPCLASEAEFVRMFVTEARLSSRLNHPNVVQVNDVFSDGGLPTLVMEYVEGQALSSILKRAAAELPLELHLFILCEVLAGLQHAHDQRDYDGSTLNLVHRDVSPQNVVVSYDGQVKVLDFGIAKANGLASHTRTGVIRGKLRYMAPEQVRGEVMDRRVDVFAIGVMLWEALTKQRMWQGLQDREVMRRIAAGEIDRPSDVAPGCDPELERLCLKALAPSADDRFQSAAELRTELEDFLSSRSVTLPGKRVGAFMKKHFGVDCERTRRRVQTLISAMPDVAAMAPARKASLLPGLRTARRRAKRAFKSMSPLTALLCGGFLAGTLTWAVMSFGVTPAAAQASCASK
jgi:serine/threonine protein kinase